MGEAAHATAGLSRGAAEEVVQLALSKYEDQLDQQPYGKPFPEVYDIETIQPKTEWLDLYEQVKSEAIGWGLPLDKVGPS